MQLPTFTDNIEKPQDFLLLKKISEKDKNALSDLYDLYSKYLYTIIFFILKDKGEAEDTLQEVFLLIWEKIDTYDDNLGNPLSWITRISRNKAIDKLRSKDFRNHAKETDIESIFDLSSDCPSENPENAANSLQEKLEIKNAFSLLSEDQRKLIEFAYYSGYSQSELAEKFNLPLGTVKTRIRSGMLVLRNQLKHLI